MTTDDDSAAIRRCQSGDIGGLESLMARHQLSALRLAYLLTGERTQAEDVVQDSFLQVFRSIRRFRSGNPFTPWLHGIVTHVAYQRMRRITRRREVSLSTLTRAEEHNSPGEHGAAGDTEQRAAMAAADPAEHAEQAERRAAVLQALATLTQKQREAVVLRYYVGCSDQEMAAVLGCSAGTARQRLHAGRAALERVIREQFGWLLIETSLSEAVSEKGDTPHV
ncbi:MAG TPA: RNA polymerase sigma factor [Ktedonobacterales bacterium]